MLAGCWLLVGWLGVAVALVMMMMQRSRRPPSIRGGFWHSRSFIVHRSVVTVGSFVQGGAHRPLDQRLHVFSCGRRITVEIAVVLEKVTENIVSVQASILESSSLQS